MWIFMHLLNLNKLMKGENDFYFNPKAVGTLIFKQRNLDILKLTDTGED